MSPKEKMIIIDGKLVTSKVSYCKYNANTNTYTIIYKNSNKYYCYPLSRIKVIENPVRLNINNYYFLLNGQLLENIKEVYEYNIDTKYYYHIVLNDNKIYDYDNSVIAKVTKESHDTLEYIKRTADIISIDTTNGEKILTNQVKKIKIDSQDTALANYLKISSELDKSSTTKTLIFPFGCNSSQYEAVKNAIYNRISVIEGPPGTGKTQTILNIIANIIIRGMNCQVVSNNNSAIENIQEKLKEYNMDFFTALLGKTSNKDSFIENQINDYIPSFEFQNIDIKEIEDNLIQNSQIVQNVYKAKKELAILVQEKKELSLEYRYFKKTINNNSILEINRFNKDRLKTLLSELISINKISFLDKLKFVFIYGIGDFKFYSNDIETILNSISDKIYINDIQDLESKIKAKESFININKECETKFIESSMIYFKKYLSSKYKRKRKKYNSKEIWQNGEDFLNDFPVILSTTYSSRNTFNNAISLDYIIMDESSQIDIVTGTLALSSAKYAVIIGDEKQLQNIVPSDVKEKTDKLFDEYSLDKGYSYSLNSFLSSVKKIIPNIQIKMLEEHYRCHPKIINFCNKKFYNNQLVIMTTDNNEDDVIKIIRTNKGNHSRDGSSQRQVDIIKKLIPELKSKDIGIIAPYNNQVDLIKDNIKGVEVSTIHKFQGREKDVIIISTVDDKITDFVANANILNVAISRAKKQLIFIVTGNDIKNSNINDFINYVYYNNMEIFTSKVCSVFDILYKQHELERLEFYKKHEKISNYDSENLIYYLIRDIVKDYENLDFIVYQPLNKLIRDKSLLTERENSYASNHNTHIDFYIFNSISKRPVLAIEVDGYKYHRKGTNQYERDLLKNGILEKYNIPLLRLMTNGSEEEKKIRSKLDEIIG